MSDQDITVFCGNLSDLVTEEILYELFLQAGPVEDVRIPTKDGKNRTFGFVIFKHRSSVRYALELLKGTELFGKQINLQNKSIQNNESGIKSRLGYRNGDDQSMEDMYLNSRSDYGGYGSSYDMNMTSSLRGSSVNWTDHSMIPRGYSKNDRPRSSYNSSYSSSGMYTPSSPYLNPYSRDNFMNSHNRDNYSPDWRDSHRFKDRHRNNSGNHSRHVERRKHEYDRHRRFSRSRSRSPYPREKKSSSRYRK